MTDIFIKQQKTISISDQNLIMDKYLKTKDITYREQILSANYKLILSLVKSYTKYNNDENLFNDLLSAALYEAVICLDRYEGGKGNCTPTSWIRTCVSNLLSNYVKSGGLLKMNTTYYNKIKDEIKLSDLFYHRYDRYPVKGETIEYINKKGELCIHKFRDRVPIMVVGDAIPTVVDNVDYDIDGETDVYENTSYLKKKVQLIYEKLDDNEKMVIDSFYFNKYEKKDLIHIMQPKNDKEYETFWEKANNEVIVSFNGQQQVYTIYGVLNGLRLSQKPEKISQVIDNKLPKSTILYTKRDIYIFKSQKEVDIYCQGEKIMPQIRNGLFIYKIPIKNKGYIHTLMTLYNVHKRIIAKLQNLI